MRSSLVDEETSVGLSTRTTLNNERNFMFFAISASTGACESLFGNCCAVLLLLPTFTRFFLLQTDTRISEVLDYIPSSLKCQFVG